MVKRLGMPKTERGVENRTNDEGNIRGSGLLPDWAGAGSFARRELAIGLGSELPPTP